MVRELLPRKLLDKTATVYAEDATTGAFTVVVKTGLTCRLGHVSARGAASAPERADLVAMRRLIWPADYDMPAHVQVEVDGQRWNPVPGSFVAPTVGGQVAYRACDLIRVE